MSRNWSSYGRSGFAARGVTLLEVVLAMGLLVVVSSFVYWFYAASLETSHRGTEETRKLRLARVVLDRIATEIRQASVITADNRVGIRGEEEHIWLSSYRVPSRELSKERSFRDKPPRGEYDIAKVEYKIARHPEVFHKDGYEYPLGLARVEIMIPRPDRTPKAEGKENEQGTADGEGEQASDDVDKPPTRVSRSDRLDGILRGDLGPLDDEEDRGDASLGPEIQWEELYAPEIRYLRLCYYDGHKWWDSWDVTGENPLPQLVMVTIGFEPHSECGEEFGLDEENEEFCECLNKDPIDCEPLPEDQFSTVVRVTQADPLFRSRVNRETQAMVQELTGGP